MEPKKLGFSGNAAWNTAGLIVYNLCLWATTAVVLRLSDYEKTGVYQLAMTISNVFALLAAYDLKIYFVSDTEGRISTGEYRAAQLVSSLAALALCFVYALFCGYRGGVLGCVTAYMLFRVICTWSEIFWGVQQRHGRMDRIGISNILRGVLLLVVFTLVLALTKNPALASLGMALSALGVFFYDRHAAARCEDTRFCFRRGSLKELLLRCLPAVLAVAAFSAVVTVPRQQLAALCGQEALGAYATVATPVVVVQVLVLGLFDPLLRDASECCRTHDTRRLRSMGLRIGGFLLLTAILALPFCKYCGAWALTLLYGESVREFAYLLYPVVLCTVLFCASWAAVNMLIVLRRMKLLLLFALLSLAAAALAAPLCIARWSLNGVSYAVLIAYAVFLLPGTATVLWDLR